MFLKYTCTVSSGLIDRCPYYKLNGQMTQLKNLRTWASISKFASESNLFLPSEMNSVFNSGCDGSSVKQIKNNSSFSYDCKLIKFYEINSVSLFISYLLAI